MINIDVLNTGRIVLREDKTGIIEGDSGDYEILQNAARKTKHLKGLTVEIGVRYGLGSVIIMDQNDHDKTHISIDPYGNIEYADDVHGTFSTDYSNQMRNKCQYAITQWAHENGKNIQFLVMEDTEYFKRYADGFPLYNNGKKLESKYSLVHFDGPHTTNAVITEVEWFLPRVERGGMLVFDDIDLYDHNKIEEIIHKHGYIVSEKGTRKASYMNVRK